jgi:hypothetical protein
VVHLSNLLEHGWLTAIGICILAMAVLHLTVGGSAIFVQTGLFVVIIARAYRGRSAEVSSSIDGTVRFFSSSRVGRVVDFWDDVHGYWDIFHNLSGIMTLILE